MAIANGFQVNDLRQSVSGTGTFPRASNRSIVCTGKPTARPQYRENFPLTEYRL